MKVKIKASKKKRFNHKDAQKMSDRFKAYWSKR